ncbi:MAG TPA: hypothetical protein VKH46_09015 [Thermoanaerobaculia bacterium]|jgi:hypothetical protein|nr:hypothetical protein [Thermoanaerobaculia bacterium]
MREETKNFGGTILFVFYCAGVGMYLLLRPWAPDAGPASPYLRGFISGLGLVHLVAGVNDFRLLFRRMTASR